MKSIFAASIIITLFFCSACEKESTDTTITPEGVTPISLKGGSEEVIAASNKFGIDMFNLLFEVEDEGKNIFISPTSISLALAMTWNGANAETEDSMAYALRMDHLDNTQINETYRDLIAGLTTVDEKVLLEIANSIWCRQGFSVEQSFLNINEDFYAAEVEELDFSAPESVDVINNWVSDKTHEKIPKIINQISPENVMFLINAIYFKGIWKIDFNKENTREEPFFLQNKEIITTEMMNMEERIGYFENDLMQSCELDYGGGNYSMIVMLPKADKSLTQLTSQFETVWKECTEGLSSDSINLRLPKFTFKYEKKLNDELCLMGMRNAFDPGIADFSGINPVVNLYIDYVKHKTFVEVNEEGTEAAAVTVVAISFTSAEIPSQSVTKMTVNRPFLFAIREKASEAIVFMGKVANPNIEE